MKKIIILLLFLGNFTLAQENSFIEKLEFYKTSNQDLTLDEVKNKTFLAVKKSTEFKDANKSYWLKATLSDEMKSGAYIVKYAGLKFDLHSFTPEQGFYRMTIGGASLKFGFNYKKERDSRVYYFHLLPQKCHLLESYVYLQSVEEFYLGREDYLVYLLICGIVIGLIFMAGLYNAFIYYYNREKVFLYYAFMQFFMVSIQFFYTGLLSIDEGLMQVYNFLSLLTALFATLFTKAFFNTATYLPKWDKLLQFYILLLLIDMMINALWNYSFMDFFQLYSIFGVIYLFVAYQRLKEGFKPAKFFLFGWGILIFLLFILEYFEEYLPFNLLLLGSPIEAIFLALALAYKIKLVQIEKEQQREMLVHQSKLASMGEMIGNIAHQWRQPLTHLSYSVMNIQDAFKHNSLDEVYLDKKVKEATTQIEFMSQTIDDFKDFYAPSKNKENFSLEEATEEVLEIMKHALDEKDIVVDLFVSHDARVENYKNEYKQVLLNLLANAKDVLVERVVLNPKIIIMIRHRLVMVSDNAGGVDQKSLNKIFEPYFTTKEGNIGIGLYMSKMIIEKNMGGNLTVSNGEEGADFMIIF